MIVGRLGTLWANTWDVPAPSSGWPLCLPSDRLVEQSSPQGFYQLQLRKQGSGGHSPAVVLTEREGLQSQGQGMKPSWCGRLQWRPYIHSKVNVRPGLEPRLRKGKRWQNST